LALLLYFGAVSVVRPFWHPYPWSDFATFYSAAEAFEAKGEPYSLLELRRGAPAEYEGWVGRYFYPPPFAAVAIRPLLWVPFDAARRAWVLLETAAYLLAGLVLTRLVFASMQLPALACVGALLLPFAPMTLDLRLGSVSAILLLLTSLFMLERQRGHAWRAALALAAAIVLKLSPALVAGYLALRGERRLALRTFACVLLLLLVALPWTGVRAYRSYVVDTLPFLATENFSWFTNQSIDAFFWRLFVPNPDTTPWLDSPPTYRACTLLVGVAVLVALACVARRERLAASTPTPAWGVALALCASVLLARVSWEYMFVLVLPALALALRDVLGGTLKRRETLVLIAAYALCAAPIPYTKTPWREGAAMLLGAPRFYGAILLFALLTTRRLRHRTAPTPLGAEK
jgi:hypothetical protein